MKRHVMLLIAALVLGFCARARAQNYNCTDVGVNLENSTAAITVDNTSGGITVAAHNPEAVCARALQHSAIGSGIDVNCCPTTGNNTWTATSTVASFLQG